MRYHPTGAVMLATRTLVTQCAKGKTLGSGYVWSKDHWRRARSGECGMIPDGMKGRQHNADGTITHVAAKGGKVAVTKTTLTPELQDCVDAGVPQPYLAECANLRRRRAGKPQMQMTEVLARLQGNAAPPADAANACAAAGVPAGMVNECAMLLQQGVPLPTIVAAAQQQTKTAAPRKFPLIPVLAVGGGLLVYLLLRRKK